MAQPVWILCVPAVVFALWSSLEEKEAAWARRTVWMETCRAWGATKGTFDNKVTNNQETSTMSNANFDPNFLNFPKRGSVCAKRKVMDDGSEALIVVGYDPDGICADGSHERTDGNDVLMDDEDDGDLCNTDADMDSKGIVHLLICTDAADVEIVTNC